MSTTELVKIGAAYCSQQCPQYVAFFDFWVLKSMKKSNKKKGTTLDPNLHSGSPKMSFLLSFFFVRTDWCSLQNDAM
jgi:hypothetical protein